MKGLILESLMNPDVHSGGVTGQGDSFEAEGGYGNCCRNGVTILKGTPTSELIKSK
jgi:hypothetical protein